MGVVSGVARPGGEDVDPGGFESFYHSGSLAFPDDDLKKILRLLDTTPTLDCVNLEWPAVLP